MMTTPCNVALCNDCGVRILQGLQNAEEKEESKTKKEDDKVSLQTLLSLLTLMAFSLSPKSRPCPLFPFLPA